MTEPQPKDTMEEAWAEYKRLQAERDRLGEESHRLWMECEQIIILTAQKLFGPSAKIDWKNHKVTKKEV